MTRSRNILPKDPEERAYAEAVQRALKVEDLEPKYREKHERGCDAMTGHCFVATNAFWHIMGGPEGPYRPKHVKVGKESHWFLVDQRDGSIVDLTASQFGRARVPYERGRGIGMRARPGGDLGGPTERARVVLDRIFGDDS